MCGVRKFASSPSSSGMLNRVYHLVVHFQKLHCKENEEVIVGFIQSHPWAVTWPTIRFPKTLIYCSIVFSALAQLISVNRVAN